MFDAMSNESSPLFEYRTTTHDQTYKNGVCDRKHTKLSDVDKNNKIIPATVTQQDETSGMANLYF